VRAVLLNEASKGPALLKQIVVRACLHDFPVFEHENVGALGQKLHAVGDEDTRFLLEHAFR